MTTLATQWQQHADATLPIDTPEADVRAAKRQWYGAQLDRLAAELKAAGVRPKRRGAGVH